MEGKNTAKFNDVKTLDVLEFYKKLLPLEAGNTVKPED